MWIGTCFIWISIDKGKEFRHVGSFLKYRGSDCMGTTFAPKYAWIVGGVYLRRERKCGHTLSSILGCAAAMGWIRSG